MLATLVAAVDGGTAPREARGGAALALQAAAPHLLPEDVPVALDFLMATGLADPDASVRSAMVAAGAIRYEL